MRSRSRRPSCVLLVAMLLMAWTPVIQGDTNDNESFLKATPSCHADRTNWTMGLIYCNANASTGYTLFSPIPSNTTYLIDHQGRYVHHWTSPGEHRPSLSAYLLPDGDLLRTANNAADSVGNFSGGGTSGKVERIAWDGTLEWSWTYDSEQYITHHDIEPMPNGNILMIAWEDKTEAEALQAGRNPAIASDSPGGQNNVWPDHIIEVRPIGNDDAEIVWKWHAWDHLIQDYDPTKDNYGVVEEHPEKIDINYVGGTGNAAGRADWMHCNGIDYNAQLDQIALSCRSMNEIYIIDHSTTTEEAAGSTGGQSGKGGDILYRWGNPQVYDKGLSSDQQLFAQHDVQWIEAGHPEAGNLIVFNNGNGRYPAYSSVDIIRPTLDNGTYVLEANGTYGPNGPAWSWDQGESMYSGAISGAQALPSGNMLVTHGTQGTLYEVNQNGDVVWEYIGPIGANGPFNQSETLPEGNLAGSTANAIFKATHYSEAFLNATGQTYASGTYLENWVDACPEQDAWGWDRDGDGCVDDSDGDGVNDPEDRCELGDDGIDVDQDGIPDACDSYVDQDGDGVVDESDLCTGHDDSVDVDRDGVPDGCDELVDSDGDGVADEADVCDGDDNMDSDGDGVPDDCDATPLGETDTNNTQPTDQPSNNGSNDTDVNTEVRSTGDDDSAVWSTTVLAASLLLVGVGTMVALRRRA